MKPQQLYTWSNLLSFLIEKPRREKNSQQRACETATIYALTITKDTRKKEGQIDKITNENHRLAQAFRDEIREAHNRNESELRGFKAPKWYEASTPALEIRGRHKQV